MSEAGWAERAINKLPMALGSDSVDAKAAIKLVEAEHKRAVRVVKKEIKWQAARIAEEQQAHNADGEAIHNYARLVAHDILAALQKGRI